ncbi:MAG: glutamine-hydrolyzing GMP synthase, partial [Oscillospiraceae bacterium]|nr:glutamine-hydrolyzing GMP synthase [Oscillospiraceae bacterium]
MDKILVLDFGGQYNQLIARRVREQRVFAEVRGYDKITLAEIVAAGYAGIIFTGGPNSVYEESAPHFDPAILDAGIPILGICYGCQLLAWMGGGEIRSAGNISEYGKVELLPCAPGDPLLRDVPETSVCWMSHTDYVSTPPTGFSVTARTRSCPCAAFSDPARRLYGVQFHPEVTHTEYGAQILRNFLFSVCACAGDWSMGDYCQRAIAELREKIGSGRVLLALSGGV